MANENLSERYRLVAKEYVQLDSAATLMEELKSATLSQKMIALGDIPVSRAETQVKASEEWKNYISEMCRLREAANMKKVEMEWIRYRFMERQSREATARAEMKL